jgi:hypothetical protein
MILTEVLLHIVLHISVKMNQLQEINLSSLAIIYSTGEENELA